MKNIKGITGILINYYFVCPRRLWFCFYRVNMENESELVKIGKYIEIFYKKEKKINEKIILDDNISVDWLKKSNDCFIVIEIKKSSKIKEAAIWQLKYYLFYLENKGIRAKGKLIIPEEKYEELVELSEKDKNIIKKIIENIREILSKDKLPKVIKKKICYKCSYYMLCWSEY